MRGIGGGSSWISATPVAEAEEPSSRRGERKEGSKNGRDGLRADGEYGRRHVWDGPGWRKGPRREER